MNPGSQYEQVTGLVSALLDGRISADEQAQLTRLLAADPEARKLYMQLVDLELELNCLVVPQNGSHVPQFPSAPPARPNLRVGWAIAASIVLAATLCAVWRSPKPPETSTMPPATRVAEPVIPNEWREDFEAGALGAWTGELMTNRADAPGRIAVSAVPLRYAGDVAYGIRTPEDWSEGLVNLTSNTVLEVSYWLGTPEGMNVFLHTISTDPAGPRYHMYQLKTPPGFHRFGQWHTTSVRFSNFVRKVPTGPAGSMEFHGGPPQPGERMSILVFSSPNPIDLLIDRIAVTDPPLHQQPL